MKLIPLQYVKPYVKRGKNDTADNLKLVIAILGPQPLMEATRA